MNMRGMDFGDTRYPSLDDFRPYEYMDGHPEEGTAHHGLRYELPGSEAYFLIEYVAPDPELDDPGGYVWYFQDSKGNSREDLSGGFDSVREAYDNMKARFDLETGRTEVFTMVIPDLNGHVVHYAYSSLEGSLQAATDALDAHGEAAKDFEVPIRRNGQPFATLTHGEAGWQMTELSTHAKERNVPDALDEAMKEARNRSASKEGKRMKKPNLHQEPEL